MSQIRCPQLLYKGYLILWTVEKYYENSKQGCERGGEDKNEHSERGEKQVF